MFAAPVSDRSGSLHDDCSWDVLAHSLIRCGAVISVPSQAVGCRILRIRRPRTRLRADHGAHGLNVGNVGFLDSEVVVAQHGEIGEVPVRPPVVVDEVLSQHAVLSLWFHC